HLSSPRLLLADAGDGTLEVYVHSGVGERAYDHLALKVNNETRVSRNHTHALIERVPAGGAFLTLEAREGDTLYRYNALVLPDPASTGYLVAPFVDGKETNRETISLPWTKLIEGTSTE
ncbi:MAG TPA: hypothetical protein VNZ52_15610, partial [Candidatus Thermoplasmatota archaeon]|nr:hypothetical protein [Candidatus Thermoplasmatota archaeon]